MPPSTLRSIEGFWRGPGVDWRTFPKAVVAWVGTASGTAAPGPRPRAVAQFGAPRERRCARGQSPRDEAIEWRSILGSGSDPRPVLEVLLILEEAVDFSLCLVLGAAVALLNLAGEDLGIAVNLIQIVVSELAPLLPDPALQLFPLSLQDLRVHRSSFGPGGPIRSDDARRMPR